jgi:outer membrane protein assembly factor BamA
LKELVIKRIFLLSSLEKWIIFILIIILQSCSPVKFVPEDRYLLNKVELAIDNSIIEKEEVKVHLRQKENYKILGFLKFHLWLYNLSSQEKAGGWLKRIGEPPEILDQGLVVASEDRIKQYLGNRGFFRARVDSEVTLKDKKQKANVKYNITTGEQYRIRELNYHFGDSVLGKIFFADSARSFISVNTPFDFNLLENQRAKIVDLFKNEGYYYFTSDEISYLADSTMFEKEIILDLFVGMSPGKEDSKRFAPQYLDHFYISVLPGTAPTASEFSGSGQFTDTISWRNHTMYEGPELRYRQGLFDNLIQMESGSLYRLNDARHTFDAFNRLRQFRFIDIQFGQSVQYPDSNLLDVQIRLAPLNKQAFTFDIEGTNTSGNMGVAGNINYRHRNMFRGAEVFQVNVKGAVERQQRVVNEVTEYFNTREIGTETSLTFPKILGPRLFVTAFRDFLPKTVFSAGYNFQRRPEYTRTISNFKYGFEWMTSADRRHMWNLVDFNLVHLYQFDPGFIDLIKDLYIKSSFTDHLIFATNYSFVHNTQRPGTLKNYNYLRFNVESAGNILYLLSNVVNRPVTTVADTTLNETSEFYRLFNTRFAQYLKSDLEFRHGHIIDKYNAIVGRAFLGVALPYGNFDVLPFEKKYFTGGANGIRAWQVRSLGPGTYRGPENAYPNQSSDIKLEANLEYRFKLIAFMEGALFLDAGNIWAVNKKDNREGALFKVNEFYKQLALGTGTGFRLDFSYFIFRLDVGMKLRDPSQELGNGWIIGHRRLKGEDFNFSFAIGYPF